MSGNTSFGQFGLSARTMTATLVLFAAGAANARGQIAIPFTEEALSRGLSYAVGTPLVGNGYGYGLAFVDLDVDGDADVDLSDFAQFSLRYTGPL